MFAFIDGKRVWYLPLAFFATVFLLCSSVGFWLGGHAFSSIERYPDSLTAIFSTSTIDALNQDPRLHGALLSLTEAIAQSSTDLGGRLRIESLKNFGTNLTDGVVLVRAKQQSELKKRGIFDDIQQALGAITGGNSGGAGGLNLGGVLSGLLSRLGGSLADSLGTPALFLGIGVGMGTSTGLNLTDMQKATAISTKITKAYNASATGFNLAAQNLGSGLAGQIASSLSFNSTGDLLGRATFALASGIGNATAQGLNLTQQRFLPSNNGGVEGIAGNFGLGIAGPIASNIDIQATIKSLSGGAGTSDFMQMLPKIASAVGMGLGEGARNGLGLTATSTSSPGKRKRQQANSILGSLNLPDVVGQFAKGLSQSFLTGSNLTNLNPLGTITPSMTDLQTMLRPLAAGAGAGIGMGVAIGLNLKSASAVPVLGGNITGKDEQTALLAQGFTQNLLSNFLTNSTAIQQAQKLISSSPPQVFKDLNGAKAAEGFARGTVEGIMSAMSSVGGIKNLISGNVSADASENVPVLAPTQFNDSVNGSAVGFARGFAGKATILVAEVVRNLTHSSRDATGPSPLRKRSVNDAVEKFRAVTYSPISSRQSQTDINPQLPVAIDAGTLQLGAQTAINVLTCQGIGGLASAALGSMAIAKVKAAMMGMMTGAPLDPVVMHALPQGPITLSSEGNQFEVVIQEQSLKINGLALVPFAVLTALHVLFAGLAFLAFLPLYLGLGVVWRFSVLTGYPINEAKNKKWRMGLLLIFSILGLTGIVLGIVGMGSARHFRDLHGIIGLFCLLLLFPATGFSIIRLRTTLPHPPSSAFAGIKGPIALGKTPQRIYLISGILIQLSLGLGQIVFLQGFATLRAISLCVVDAVLSSTVVAGVMSVVLVIQISATAFVGIRVWLEQHIAKNLATGISSLVIAEGGGGDHARPDTMQTFGFETKDTPPPPPPPPAPDRTNITPQLTFRKTEELQGFEDVAISTPFNVRKDGSLTEPAPTPPSALASAQQQDPRLSSAAERFEYYTRTRDFP
ncbi:hypothetical protein EJ02DRAFT_513567 [Clathrospora elynae]|uniref:Cytochrome b561 domain-containing protein n=1 Tax=Clathrospora elynae TaxID=706981 RepID=A0A6A5SIV9_9PLEO|nr:hypothetical protein EJ02DRAFT_513567 [Clathrospora elynae]